MPNNEQILLVLIASFIEEEQVERIRQVDPKLDVVYEPSLLRPPRYSADHTGKPVTRTAEKEEEWRKLLAKADIMFDFDYTNIDSLPELAPNVRWIQATSAGIGQFVRRTSYATRMPNTIFTTASSVHAQPLAEFVLMSMLMFSRNMFSIQEQQSRKHWERLAGTDLVGRTMGIIGLGNVGRGVAGLAKPIGLRVIGNDLYAKGKDPADYGVDALYGPDGLDDMLGQSEFLVLCTPHTDETDKMIGAHELAMLPEGAILINIARGAVVDEAALIESLQSGHVGGAALDVFEEEPLPIESPLWDMPNVLVSPHSASTSDRENERIVDIFCANLRSYLDGQPMQNVLDPNRLF